MAPQEHIPAAASILGTIGTIVGAFRIWYNWRRKQTDGLPGLMLFLWAAAAIPFGIYDIVQNFNIPLQVQPQVFCALTLICWAQTLIYGSQWRIWTASLAAILTGIIFAGIETVLILTLRGPYDRGVEWPVTMIGIIAAILLAVGLLPPYFEMWKRSGRVVGINFVFLIVDFSGALFSLMALVAQQTFDVLGGTLYIVCMALEIGIFSSHFFWLYRTRRIRRAAKLVGKSYDDYMEDHDTPPQTPTHPPGTASTLVGMDATRNNSTISTETAVEKSSAHKEEKVKEVTTERTDVARDVEKGL